MIGSLILRIFGGLMIIWNWDSNVYLFILHPYVGWWYPANMFLFSQEDEKGETIKQICLDDRQICSLLVGAPCVPTDWYMDNTKNVYAWKYPSMMLIFSETAP